MAPMTRSVPDPERARLLQGLVQEEARWEDTDRKSDSNASGLQGYFRPGGLMTSVFTLSAMSLGVGVFVLPMVFTRIGLISGVVSIIFFAAWSYWLQIVMVRAAKSYGVDTYEMLAEKSLGVFGKYGLAFFTMITNCLANAAHMKTAVLLLHDQMELYITDGYAKHGMTETKELILYVPLLLGAFFLCTGSKVSDLRFVSTASVTIVLLLCIWMTGECFFWYMPKGTHAFEGNNTVIMANTEWKAYAADLPAVAFAFTSTFMLFPVYREMADQSDRAVSMAVGSSTILCGVGYMVLAVVAVLTFGKNVVTNPYTGKAASSYIYTFPPTHLVIVFLSFLLAIALTMLYAIINYPFIQAVETLLELVPSGRPMLTKPIRHSVITLCGMIALVAINLAFRQPNALVILFGLCGGWGVTFVVYAIPSVVALGSGERADPPNSCLPPIVHRALLLLSLVFVIVIAGAFTSTLPF